MSLLDNSFSRESVKVLLQESFYATLQKTHTHLEDFLSTQEEESLHQYRVTLRSARSVCREFQHFFHPKRGCALGERLKKLQHETNEMRDIDVFLECIEGYKEKVDASCIAELESIEQALVLEKKRVTKHFLKRMKRRSPSRVFKKISTLWRHKKLYLPKSEEAMLKHIKPIIEKRIEKIEKLTQQLSIHSENELFHTLRLHCKKIRYTTDSFCVDNPRIKAFSSLFKALQTALGQVQDANTQIAKLTQYRSEENGCIGQIIGMLERECELFKRTCIEKSNQEAIDTIKNNFKAIF